MLNKEEGESTLGPTEGPGAHWHSSYQAGSPRAAAPSGRAGLSNLCGLTPCPRCGSEPGPGEKLRMCPLSDRFNSGLGFRIQNTKAIFCPSARQPLLIQPTPWRAQTLGIRLPCCPQSLGASCVAFS